MAQPAVFISYSHKDEAWKDRLVSHLRVLEYEGELEVWDDRRIEAGDEWRAEIKSALESATVAILIISKDFLTSRFIREQELTEILAARQQGRLKVIPLIAEPCAWQEVSVLQGIQARPKDGRPLSAVAGHQADEDLARLAVEIVKGTQRIEVNRAVHGGIATTVAARRMTPSMWLVIALGGSGVAAALLTYAAYNWHVGTNVRLELFTERLHFATRGTQSQLLDLGIEFSRLTFARCGTVEFEGFALSSQLPGPPPARLLCRDADAKIALEGDIAASPRLGTLSDMTLEPGTEVILSVSGRADPVLRIERSGHPFTLDVTLEHGLDVVTNFIDVEPAPRDESIGRQDLTRYSATPVESAPRHAVRFASSERGDGDLVMAVSASSPPPRLRAPISIENPAVTKESAGGYATTALVASGSLAYVDYPTIDALPIPEDNAIDFTTMNSAQIRALSLVSTPPSTAGKAQYALHVTVEGTLESARVGRGDPGQSEKTDAGRWVDPRLTLYDIMTNGWWKLAVLAASWTIATVAGAYLGWRRLSE